jgi:hypothetical protein
LTALAEADLQSGGEGPGIPLGALLGCLYDPIDRPSVNLATAETPGPELHCGLYVRGSIES